MRNEVEVGRSRFASSSLFQVSPSQPKHQTPKYSGKEQGENNESFVHYSSNRHLLDTYYVPGPDTRGVVIKKQRMEE